MALFQIEIFQNRTLPLPRFSLTTNGVAFDLTGKTVNLVIGRNTRGEVLIRRPCEVVGSPKEGRCVFRWEPGDTDFPESGLDAELELVLADGRNQTIATGKVTIRPSLGGG